MVLQEYMISSSHGTTSDHKRTGQEEDEVGEPSVNSKIALIKVSKLNKKEEHWMELKCSVV